MRSQQDSQQKKMIYPAVLTPMVSISLTHIIALENNTSPFTWTFVELFNSLVTAGCYATFRKSFSKSKAKIAKIDELVELFSTRQNMRPLQQALLAPEARDAYSIFPKAQDSAVNIPHIPKLIITPADLIKISDDANDNC